jgi:hypothetical protein
MRTLLQQLEDAYRYTTPGGWKKGLTTHHTVTETGYHIAEFHHADDANFCDVAHNLAPQIIAALRQLGSIPENKDEK